MKRNTVYTKHSTEWRQDITTLLDCVDLANALGDNRRFLIKPNLIKALQPPITTPVGLVGALVDYLKDTFPGCEIIVADGSGALEYETWHTFEMLGYTTMARDKGIELRDLNSEPLVALENADCRRWPQMFLPAILFDVFLISAPVLKAHTLAGVTLTMKNMMGAAPPKHYHKGGHWKKASFHTDIHAAVFDLNQYRTPDFTVLDATIGMLKSHLWGPTCVPPLNIIACSYDPVAIDAYGASLLQRDWHDIGHISMANGVLGSALTPEIVSL